ncbi:MAG: hypothetical protein NTZ05_11875, partial [Chloroflexi bacterium]|nr:hypothetical protein [Chloroflexota bacterium]
MYEQDLIEYRQRKDEFFGRHPQSPLLPEQQAQFHGLNYFPPNTDLRLTLDLDTDVPHDVIVM